MIQHAHRISREQEIPHEFVVFLSELGEAVADDNAPAECGRGALLALDVELGGIVGEIVQRAADRLKPGLAFGRGRVEPPFLAAGGERGAHRVQHCVGIGAFVNQVHGFLRLGIATVHITGLHTYHCT